MVAKNVIYWKWNSGENAPHGAPVFLAVFAGVAGVEGETGRRGVESVGGHRHFSKGLQLIGHLGGARISQTVANVRIRHVHE